MILFFFFSCVIFHSSLSPPRLQSPLAQCVIFFPMLFFTCSLTFFFQSPLTLCLVFVSLYFFSSSLAPLSLCVVSAFSNFVYSPQLHFAVSLSSKSISHGPGNKQTQWGFAAQFASLHRGHCTLNPASPHFYYVHDEGLSFLAYIFPFHSSLHLVKYGGD